MVLFDRQCRVIIGRGGETGFEIGASSYNGIPLHIRFEFEKADVESPNTGKVTVWNLNREHLAELEKKDCLIIVKAGYGSNLSQAFVGTVTNASTTKEGADRMTEIEIADCRVELRDTSLSVSYAPGIRTDMIYKDVATKMGIPITFSEKAKTELSKMSSGLSFVGGAKDILKRLSKIDGNCWTIQDGILQITKPGEPITLTGYELNASSGLIGLPKRVNQSASASDANATTITDSETAQLGWEITYLMNLSIGVNSYVHITSEMVTGYFRVQKISIAGDNYEGDWMCTATVLEVKKT